MKFTKHLISGACAVAVAGTLSLAFAQTNAPGTTTPGTQAAPQGAERITPGPPQPMAPGTTGTMNSGTTGTMNSGTNATSSNDSTSAMNRSTTRRSNNRGMNADGTMSTERVARADRG